MLADHAEKIDLIFPEVDPSKEAESVGAVA